MLTEKQKAIIILLGQYGRGLKPFGDVAESNHLAPLLRELKTKGLVELRCTEEDNKIVAAGLTEFGNTQYKKLK